MEDGGRRYLPEDVVLEELKVDAQGHDAEVVAGVGKFLPRFKCIIGEFDTTAYAAAEKSFSVERLLQDAGFVFVANGMWVNTRFAADFKAGRYICSAYDVEATQTTILAALRRAPRPPLIHIS
eukprot:TRINITY_DN4788_c0_g1_i2.p3 TRINITY_DN4788_c0_g1~~TRINITY_DN4788_c0_g1_i2.p3  ORF type:complete len:123 (+),score=46.90 TRINITY_DN4788_c0_g1_i2:85-453(+)